ncbi:hypothetical protein [Levilactobacillus brevis]|uniref:hypothetical protein n=1 Tax=Levilactobacillus brevis TaxID=1580 RepID=UPI001EF634C4|nr:hypothetical protein [Levilactobacillus brevis]ULH75563.1 hypothetical protein MD222_12020 [Levilactobacillus brevis]
MASNDEQRSATTILTTAAQSIAARLIANETTAKFTKAEISTTNLFNQSVTELQVLTSLDNVQQTADINTVTVINNNTVNVNVAIDQTKAPNNYQMNSVGLFAVDGDGKEVLYSVTVLKDPVYIHQDAMGSALGIDLETVVGQASNVEISVNPAGAVTNEILKATLADYVKTDDVKSLIPATVIDGSKPADFKEVVTLEKGAVDGAGNTIATTKDVSDGDAATLTSAKAYADTKVSGKADDSTVVHTADMRKPASDVAGIEEVNAKQDKLTITPADDSKVVHDNKDNTIQVNGTQVSPYNKLTDTIGGRNYLISSKLTSFPTYSTNPVVTNGGRTISTTYVSSTLNYLAMAITGFKPIGQYTISGKMTINGAPVTSATFINNVASTYNSPYTATDTHKIDDNGNFVFTETYSGAGVWIMHTSIAGIKAGDVVVIEDLKFEKGSVATDWTPAPEDKVNVADMRKPASDVAGIEEVNAKQDKLDYTPANAANVVDRNPDTGVVSEPTDFTNLTVNGGKSVATSDDLKSLEDASWHTITGKSDSLSAYTCMYRKNNEKKYVDLVLYGIMGISMAPSDSSKELLDLSGIISSINGVNGVISCPETAATGGGISGSMSISGTKLLFSWNVNNNILYSGRPIISSGNDLSSPFLRVTFD